MACDICGKKGTALTDLRDSYKSAEVSQVCSGCEAVINKQLKKVQSFALGLIPTLLKRFIVELRGIAEKPEGK